MQGYAPHIIATWIEGRLITGLKQPSRIDHILFDSRKLAFPDTTIFFALTDGRRNGHEYITDLYSRGVRAFVVSEEPAGKNSRKPFLFWFPIPLMPCKSLLRITGCNLIIRL